MTRSALFASSFRGTFLRFPYGASGALLRLLLPGLGFGCLEGAEAGLTHQDEDPIEQWLRMEEEAIVSPGDLEEWEDFLRSEEWTEPVPIWDVESRLAAGGGYRDNVRFSAVQRESGAFALGSVETTVSRISLDGRSFTLVLDGETLHFPSGNLPDDTFASVFGQVRSPVAGNREVSLSFLGFHFDQVIDPSATEDIRDPVKVRGAGANFVPAFLLREPGGRFAEASLFTSRQAFRHPLDDYWEAGPRIDIGQRSPFADIALGIRVLARIYDDRNQRSRDGAELPDTDLKLRIVRPEITYRYALGENERWRGRSRIGMEFIRDDGSGYFDYDRLRFSQQLGFQGERWSATGRAGYSLYDYQVQAVGADEPRKRRTWSIDIEVRRRLFEDLDGFGRYEWQEVRSNEKGTNYSVNTWSGGVGWTF